MVYGQDVAFQLFIQLQLYSKAIFLYSTFSSHVCL